MQNKFFDVSIHVLSSIFGLVILICSIIVYQNYYINEKAIKEYINNWEHGPINDIISSKNSTCPKNYEKLLSGEFPKIDEGCDCMKSKYYRKKIYEYKCSIDQLKENCTKINPTEPLEYKKWRGTYLCAKRITTNFWNVTYVAPNYSCPIGMKKCGLLDTFNNSICVQKTNECPISYIQILPSNSTPNYNYKKVDLADNLSLYFTSDNLTSTVVVNLIPSTDGICVMPDEGKLGHDNYILNSGQGIDTCKTKINNFTLDARYRSLDKYNLNRFYDDNLVSNILDNLPNYPVPDNKTNVGLYRTGYFSWDRKCFNDPTIRLNFENDIIDDYNLKSLLLVVICLSYFMFIFVIVVVYKFLIESFNSSRKSTIIIESVSLVLALGTLGYSIYLFVLTRNLLQPFEHLLLLRCGDNRTNLVMDKVFEHMRLVGGYLIVIIIFSAILAITFIGYLIYSFIIDDGYQELKNE